MDCRWHLPTVFDIGQSDDLACSERHTHQRSEGVKHGKAGRETAGQREERSEDSRPEQDRRPPPEVNWGNPQESTDAQHYHVQVAGVVDRVRGHIPFCAL